MSQTLSYLIRYRQSIGARLHDFTARRTYSNWLPRPMPASPPASQLRTRSPPPSARVFGSAAWSHWATIQRIERSPSMTIGGAGPDHLPRLSQARQPQPASDPIDDRSRINKHVVRIEVQAHRLVIQLASAQAPHQEQAEADGVLHIPRQKTPSRRRREIF
jgi:hypothetical protein